MEDILTEAKIAENYQTLLNLVAATFPTRKDKLLAMYDEYEASIITAPASSIAHFHNAFPGGYVDHVIRVAKIAIDVFKLYKSIGLYVENISLEEVVFSALHHDLGKVGLVDTPRYILNDSEWHRKTLGQIYTAGEELQYMQVPHMSIYLLQRYEIPVTLNEFLAILIHDGLYEEGNKPYFKASKHKSRLRSNLPHILHHADLMASQFEYERWAKVSGKELKHI